MSALWPPRAGQRSTSGCQLCVGLRSLVRLTPGDSTRPKTDIGSMTEDDGNPADTGHYAALFLHH
jgi:hypothetical protein